MMDSFKDKSNFLKRVSKSYLLLSACLALAGCGGGSGPESSTQQKTANLTFGILSTATLQGVPINGIHVTATLPAGMTIITDAGNRQITSGFTPLKSNVSFPILGRYSATTRQVVFDVYDTSTDQSGIGFGDFATLTGTVPAGTPAPEEGDFHLSMEATGYSYSAADGIVDLTGKTRPTIKSSGF